MTFSHTYFSREENRAQSIISTTSQDMADDKLKDLAELKDQLEEIERRVEKEVQAGIPQGGSVLASPFLKGFLAGYVVSRLRSSAVLGVVLGTCTGIFAAQNFGVPNIEETLKDYFNTLKGPSK
ncbi:SLC35A4 upstream open reading frame protein-like [Oncorhynchus nerka]|uniref:SLC35A4 upstream open reading frame protein-like n=1 Tax=Oncorhynchus nerka TaxID=8023 RepID=UPI001130026A|nr:SLC35A4 upstream open reading frame protein-like [Oncorhynchus nerka]